MLECCVHQMPADVSRGVVQLSRGLGNQSEGVGWRWRDSPGPIWPGQTSSRFPGEACSLAHLLLANVRGGDGPSGQEDVQAARTFF